MDAIIAIDDDSTIIEFNRSAEEMFGWTRADAVGQRLEQLIIPDQHRAGHLAGMAHLRTTGEGPILGKRLELVAQNRAGKVFPVELTVSAVEGDSFYVASLRDLTDRNIAQQHIQRSDRLFRAISTASQQYIREGNVDETFAIVLNEVLDITDSEYGFVSEVLYDPSGDPYIRTYALTNIAWNNEMRAIYDAMAPNLEFRNLKTLFGSMLTTGEVVIANDPSTDPRRGGLPPGHPPLDRFCGLPIHHTGELVGMIGLSNRPQGYDLELVEFLEPFLAACGNIIVTWRADKARIQAEAERKAAHDALELSRRREAEISAGIQNSLLLRRKPVLTPHGMDVGVCIMGFTAVTGDYCDFVTFNDRFDIIVGDVMGKGVTAAMVGSAVKGQLHRVVRRLQERTMLFGRHPEPQEIVGGLQSVLTPQLMTLDSFVTLTYAAFERRDGADSVTDITIVDAGHTPILRIRDGIQAHWLSGDNVPLGLADREFYMQNTYRVEPGDVYIFFSDGVTEAANQDDVPFGKDRVEQVSVNATNARFDSESIANRLAKEVMAWTGERIDDDITIVVVKIDEAPSCVVVRKERTFREFSVESSERNNFVEFLESYLQDVTGITDYDRHAVIIGVTEAVNNIVEHGLLFLANQRIQLEIEVRTTDIEIVICDRGREYTEPAVKEISIEDVRERGYGWMILRKCFQNVSLVRNPLGYNILTLQRKTGLVATWLEQGV
jgi:PAS domain S-box-containing protein